MENRTIKKLQKQNEMFEKQILENKEEMLRIEKQKNANVEKNPIPSEGLLWMRDEDTVLIASTCFMCKDYIYWDSTQNEYTCRYCGQRYLGI